MTRVDRTELMVLLGKYLLSGDEYLEAVIKRTAFHNPWFTVENQQQAIRAIATEMLDREKLETWLSAYPETDAKSQTVGLVLAGNLPLVGFHDILCVFLSGHKAMIKLSDKDPYLLPALLRYLHSVDERSAACFELVDKLQNFDAVIATGSNNTARYFEAYFGSYPNIIRKSRNGVAVLSGRETTEELQALANDVFAYFGLGCRSVSKLYVPKDYNFEQLLEAFHEHKELVMHTKYKNNFDYNYALFILNKVAHHANGCVLVREEQAMASPIACLYFEYYENTQSLSESLQSRAEEIQVVVSNMDLPNLATVPLGQAQFPALADYADGVDTMAFLNS